ncbi:hypothetical protein IM538_17370 [Cytobacillus suaedae]|nr:hypothetical protein IM538_17370 [Cytobacillus suaedae]
MDQHRKALIVKEIKLWKQSKLLPEHYCDFLLTLYTEGEVEIKKSKASTNFKDIVIALLLISLLPATLLVIYFTEMYFVLQIPIFIIFIIICLISAFFLKNNFLKQLSYIIFALLFLITTIEIGGYFFKENVVVLSSIIIFNCLLWLLAGLKMKQKYFIIAGVIGLILLIVAFFI